MSVMPKCSTSQACSHIRYWNLCLVTSGLPDSFAASSCSVFDQFLLVMMRLRLNVVQDLGYRFDVHPSTVCLTLASGLMCCTQNYTAS